MGEKNLTNLIHLEQNHYHQQVETISFLFFLKSV